MKLLPPDEAAIEKLRAMFPAGTATPRQRAAAQATLERIKAGHEFTQTDATMVA